MGRLAALILAIGLMAGTCSMPNFAPPKLGVDAGGSAVVRFR